MIEAEITIISCDRCKQVIITLQSDEERDEYKRTWFDDGVVNFCPKCRIVPEPQNKFKVQLSEMFLDKIF